MSSVTSGNRVTNIPRHRRDCRCCSDLPPNIKVRRFPLGGHGVSVKFQRFPEVPHETAHRHPFYQHGPSESHHRCLAMQHTACLPAAALDSASLRSLQFRVLLKPLTKHVPRLPHPHEVKKEPCEIPPLQQCASRCCARSELPLVVPIAALGQARVVCARLRVSGLRRAMAVPPALHRKVVAAC